MVRTVAILAAIAVSVALTSSAVAQQPGMMMPPDQLNWTRAGRVQGVEQALIIGDSSKPGSYLYRGKLPANLRIAPHSHPDDRTYTVISGTFYVGWGTTFDETKLVALPPGSFYTEPANVPHFKATRAEPVVLQVTGEGPSGMAFIDHKGVGSR